jgi:hypothetical protein
MKSKAYSDVENPRRSNEPLFGILRTIRHRETAEGGEDDLAQQLCAVEENFKKWAISPRKENIAKRFSSYSWARNRPSKYIVISATTADRFL